MDAAGVLLSNELESRQVGDTFAMDDGHALRIVGAAAADESRERWRATARK